MNEPKLIMSSDIIQMAHFEKVFKEYDLKKLKIRMYFAKYFESIDSDMADEIVEACSYASINLMSHKCVLFSHADIYDRYIELELLVPIAMFKSFNFRYLKGIAGYLLRTYPKKYIPMSSGNRLFHYIKRGD